MLLENIFSVTCLDCRLAGLALSSRYGYMLLSYIQGVFGYGLAEIQKVLPEKYYVLIVPVLFFKVLI